MRSTLDRAPRTTASAAPGVTDRSTPAHSDPDPESGDEVRTADSENEPASSSTGDGTTAAAGSRGGGGRKALRDSGTQATPLEDGPAWSSFDTKRALRILSAETDRDARMRVLRKLHVRFWHATPEALFLLLKAVGCHAELLKEYRGVVDTCKICRPWVRPGPRAITSTRICENFNEQIEVDLIFWEKAHNDPYL